MRMHRLFGLLVLVSIFLVTLADHASAAETWVTDIKSGCKIGWVSNSSATLTSATWNGPIVDGKAQGKGTFTLVIHQQDGSNPVGEGEGEMLAGLLNGKVIIRWSDGESFEGIFAKGQANGKGIGKSPRGNSYDGEWLNGLPSGKGIFTWNDGRVYEGEFLKGLAHGQGIMKDGNGRILQEGEWKDGNPVVVGLKTDNVLGIPWKASEKTINGIMKKRPDTKFYAKCNDNGKLRLTYNTTYNGISVFCYIYLYQDQMYWVQVVAQYKTDEETLKQYDTFKQGLMVRYGPMHNEDGKGMEASAFWDLGEDHILSLKMGKFKFLQDNPFPAVFINYWYKQTDDLVEKPEKEKSTADY